jgi:hypothetical protein
MQFTSGKWTQDPVTSVMVYSRAGIGVTIKNQQFYGQMYGCTLDLATSTILNYVPVGSVVDPSTLPWSLSYVRDRG